MKRRLLLVQRLLYENTDEQHPLTTFEILDLSYSKDKNKVYFRMKTVEEAQPETFKINRMTGIGDDGINKYEHGKKI